MIKHYLLLCFLLLEFSIQAQIKTATNSSAKGYNPSFFTHADVTATSDLGSEQYSVTLANRPELVGHFQYLANNSQVGDLLIDPNGGVYEIISGSFPTFTVQLLNDPSDLPEPYFDFPAAPTSPVNIARPIEPCGNIPPYAFLGQGIDSRLSVIVSNYNNNVLRDCAAMKGSTNESYVRDTLIEPSNAKELLDIVYYSTDTLMFADTTNFADGVVVEVLNDSMYVVQTDGYANINSHGLTVGEWYEAEGTAGQITNTATNPSHPVLKAINDSTTLIRLYRPHDRDSEQESGGSESNVINASLQDTVQGGLSHFRTLNSAELSDKVYVLGHTHIAPDGSTMSWMGGLFYKSATNLESENGATVIVADDGQVWLRDFDGRNFYIQWYEGGGRDHNGNIYFDALVSQNGIYNNRDRLNSIVKIAPEGSYIHLLGGVWEIDIAIQWKDIHLVGSGEFTCIVTRPAQPDITIVSIDGSNTATLSNTAGIRPGMQLWFLNPNAANGGLAYSENHEGTGSEPDIVITSISGNTITTSTPLTGVIQSGWRVVIDYTMINNAAGTEMGACSFENLQFDGNKSNNTYSLDWRYNPTMFLRQTQKAVFREVTFQNTPNENVFIDYVFAENVKGFDLNGSLFHITNDVAGESLYTNTFIGVEINGVNQGGNALMSHSEAAIVYSANSPPIVLQSCTFRNGNEAIIGNVSDNDVFPIDIQGCNFYNFTANAAQGQALVLNTFEYKETVKIINCYFEDCGYIDIQGDDMDAGSGVYEGLIANTFFTNTRMRMVNVGSWSVKGCTFDVKNTPNFNGFDDMPFPVSAMVYINSAHNINWENNLVLGPDTVNANIINGLWIDAFGGGLQSDGNGGTIPVRNIRNIKVTGGTISAFPIGIRVSNSSNPNFTSVVEGWEFEDITFISYKDDTYSGIARCLEVPAGAIAKGNKIRVDSAVIGNSNFYPAFVYGVTSDIEDLYEGATFINNKVYGFGSNGIRIGNTNRSVYNITFDNNYLGEQPEDETNGASPIGSFRNFVIPDLFGNMLTPQNLPNKSKYRQ